jgi:hypothetical protein
MLRREVVDNNANFSRIKPGMVVRIVATKPSGLDVAQVRDRWKVRQREAWFMLPDQMSNAPLPESEPRSSGLNGEARDCATTLISLPVR